MTERFARFFRGLHSPFSVLAGAGLLFMTTTRTAFAIVTLGALAWTWTLGALILTAAAKILPRRGTYVAILGILSVLAGIWLLLMFLLDPVLARESAIFITLIPAVCHFSALPGRVRGMDFREAALQSFLESLGYGVPLLGIAVLRELLGLGTISLPGQEGGLIEFFGLGGPSPVPLSILDTSAGAFLLLGYGLALFRHLSFRGEEKP